jgi:hypothetical protein
MLVVSTRVTLQNQIKKLINDIREKIKHEILQNPMANIWIQ